MSTEQIVSQPPAAAAAGAPAASAPAEGSPLATAYRSTLAGALRAADVGTQVTLGGWVHRSRNLGGILFLDLRDRAGLVQVSFATNPRAITLGITLLSNITSWRTSSLRATSTVTAVP